MTTVQCSPNPDPWSSLRFACPAGGSSRWLECGSASIRCCRYHGHGATRDLRASFDDENTRHVEDAFHDIGWKSVVGPTHSGLFVIEIHGEGNYNSVASIVSRPWCL